MASKKGTKDEPKVNKQFILDHLEEKEIDLSMCSLSRVPVKELVSSGTFYQPLLVPSLASPATSHLVRGPGGGEAIW